MVGDSKTQMDGTVKAGALTPSDATEHEGRSTANIDGSVAANSSIHFDAPGKTVWSSADIDGTVEGTSTFLDASDIQYGAVLSLRVLLRGILQHFLIT